MWKLVAGLLAIAIVSFVVLRIVAGPSPASAGIIIPPPGTDELEVNGKVDIDITLCCDASEAVNLTGSMAIERGPVSKGGTIDIEIVSMSLTGMSSLLGPNTPVTVSLNPNGGPALGQIIPAKGFAQFSIPFMDVQIGDNFHFLQQPVDMSAEITGIPPFGDKFFSQPKANPIQDNLVSGPDGVRGSLDRLNIDIKPPDKTYTITVLKQHADTKAGLPGWEMNLYNGSGCNGDPIDDDFTGGDGIAEFGGLAPGSYSVEEKMQAGWNNITPLCQDTSLPNTGGAGVSGLPACPIQPDNPFPEPGCDEFNSVASVNVEFINPPGAQIHCGLGGPTQITRSAVSGTPDNIQTAITVLDLSGTCDPGGVDVTVRQSPDRPSTGKITEQQNDEPGVLEFKANSFFDVFFEVDVGGTILHNQEPLHLECKIQGIPPYGCFYEPDVGKVILYNEDKKEVATLVHAAHIPLDPKQKLLIFTNEPKPPTTTPTPGDVTTTPTATPTGDVPTATPTLNPSFEEKIDVCIDAQVIINPGTAPIWTKSQIDALVDGADGIWRRANINITWNNNITEIDDPNPPPDGPGEHGDIIDTSKSDDEFNSLGDNANASGKEKCVRIFFIRHFVDNDGTQYETADGDVTLAEVDGKGRGHYVVVSIKAKDNSQNFAHELGHIFGLQHNDPDKDDNLMNEVKEPGDTDLNKDQMRIAREGAAALSVQPGEVTPTPTQADDTPTSTPTPQPGGGDGDANKDGTVNSIDAALVLQFIAGLTGEWPNSDTNGDATTNAIDVALILQFTAGFLPALPV